MDEREDDGSGTGGPDTEQANACRPAGRRRRGHIGLLLGAEVHRLDPHGAALLHGVARSASEHRLELTVWVPAPAAGEVVSPTVAPNEIDGVIVHTGVASDPWLTELADAKVPMVLLGRWPGAPGRGQMIDADHELGTEELMIHLAGLGRRRVAVIAGPFDVFDVILRLDAYERMRIELQLDRDPSLVATGDFSVRSGHDAMHALLRRPPAQRPDAVFAMNDQMAIGAIRAIHDVGLSVPDDIAVAGFDGTIEPMLSPMTLTSARQDMVGLGARAVRALLDLMAGALPGDAEIAPVHLVIGESTIGRAPIAVLDPPTTASGAAGVSGAARASGGAGASGGDAG